MSSTIPKILALFSLLAFSMTTYAFSPLSTTAPAFSRSQLDTRRHNLFNAIGSMVNNFGKKATASHILVGPKTMESSKAKEFLSNLKERIGNDPEKFASAAGEHSSCPSKKKGGDLGSFGPGMMVKPFDDVVFGQEVGVVHGPLSTQFGEHLILITERTGDK